MSHATIDDIWDALLQSSSGHIILTVNTSIEAKKIRGALIQHKHIIFKDTPAIKNFIGDFKLRFQTERVEDAVRMHIYRDEDEPNSIPIIGDIEIL